MQVSIEIPVGEEAPAIARRVVTSAATQVTATDRRIEDLRLLTSEVVTNALCHAGLNAEDTIALMVEASPRRIRVEVADRGQGFEPGAVGDPSPEKVGGWGLALVDGLADSWGVIRNGPNFVWFELQL